MNNCQYVFGILWITWFYQYLHYIYFINIFLNLCQYVFEILWMTWFYQFLHRVNIFERISILRRSMKITIKIVSVMCVRSVVTMIIVVYLITKTVFWFSFCHDTQIVNMLSLYCILTYFSGGKWSPTPFEFLIMNLYPDFQTKHFLMFSLFRKILLHDFCVWLLMIFYYPKRSQYSYLVQ